MMSIVHFALFRIQRLDGSGFIKNSLNNINITVVTSCRLANEPDEQLTGFVV